MKGISAVIAVILVLIITIGLGASAWILISGVITGRVATAFSIIDINSDDLVILVRNEGTRTISTMRAVADGTEVPVNFPGGPIEPGQFGKVELGLLPETGRLNVRLLTASMSLPTVIDWDGYIENWENYGSVTFYSLGTTGTLDYWYFDGSPHCSHCGCPCNDWCGDSGVRSKDDRISGGEDRCKAKEGDYTMYLRGTDYIERSFDASALSVAALSFWWKAYSCDGSEKATLKIYDGSSWIEVLCIGTNDACPHDDNNQWYQEAIDLKPYFNSNMKIRFTGCPGSWDELFVDDIRITTGVAVYVSQNEYEHFSNGNICSEDLYALENNNIIFFSAKPRAYVPVTRYDCASGVSSYDDRFGASPMRIWAKGTDASGYRKHEVIIDDTYFYAPGIATFTFSNPDNVLVYPDKVVYKGDTVSNLEPTLTYSISTDSKYVEVLFSVKNVGTSDLNVRLTWGGDEDGCGSKFRFDDGYVWWCGKDCPCGDNCPHTSYKWVASWCDAHTDVFGYIVDGGEKVTINYYEGVWIEHVSAVSLSPGETRTLRFWIVADQKGPTGNEWKPVEDIYNELFGV
jgi:hypothetical protein